MGDVCKSLCGREKKEPRDKTPHKPQDRRVVLLVLISSSHSRRSRRRATPTIRESGKVSSEGQASARGSCQRSRRPPPSPAPRRLCRAPPATSASFRQSSLCHGRVCDDGGGERRNLSVLCGDLGHELDLHPLVPRLRRPQCRQRVLERHHAAAPPATTPASHPRRHHAAAPRRGRRAQRERKGRRRSRRFFRGTSGTSGRAEDPH